MWGGKTSEYRLVSRASAGTGAATLFASALAYVQEPAWVGVALAGIAGVCLSSVIVGYCVARSKVKTAEAEAAPMMAAVKPTSRSV